MLGNLIKETATAPGTGTTVTLNGAAAGYVTFLSQFAAGQSLYYFLSDGVNTEAQVGTIATGPPATLTRGTPLWTSTGSPSRLNFAGLTTIYCQLPAQRMPRYDGTDTLDLGGRRLRNLPSAYVDPADAAREDRLPFRLISSAIFSTTQAVVVFALPAGFTRFRVDFMDTNGVSAAAMFARFSIDGGATYLAGATDYATAYSEARGSSPGLGAYVQSIMSLSANVASPVFGSIEFVATGLKSALSTVSGIASSPVVEIHRFDASHNTGPAGTATHILLGFVGVSVAQGRFRLFGGL